VDSSKRAHQIRRLFQSVPGLFFGLALIATPLGMAFAQPVPPAAKAAPAPAATDKVNLDVLEGAWVRPDGGYLILIKKVGANGQLEASYFNPKPLPFAKAQATRDGATVRLAFELQAGGYSGSTYDLVYDAANDQLKGIYYQAVMKQKFEVFFTRK
jgi:uncharacterized protein (DUF2147 family)